MIKPIQSTENYSGKTWDLFYLGRLHGITLHIVGEGNEQQTMSCTMLGPGNTK